jgi:hypothetical protein
MTIALKPTLPDGTIRSQDADRDFQDWVMGRPLTRRLLLVEVEAGGIKGDTQEKGRITGTRYNVIHAAEIRDLHEIDLSRHRIAQIRGEGGFYAKQPALFDVTDAEKRDAILDLIKDHASGLDLPMSDVDRQWVDYFGGVENAASETVQASRSLTQLQEFAYVFGALEDKKAGSADEEPVDLEPDNEDGEDGDESQDDANTVPQQTPAAAAESDSAVGGVPFTEVTEQ